VCGACWRSRASLVGQIRSDFDQRNADDNSPQHKNRVRQKTKFANAFNAIPPVQSSREKYSTFGFSEIDVGYSCPALDEGRFAIVTDVERGMRWTHRVAARTSRADENFDAYGEVVWSWRSDAGVKF
jgi:hypothetical protein